MKPVMPANFTKAEYARRVGVRQSAVSNWIARGKLTPPALRDDGRIDADLADRQFGLTVDPVASASARSRVTAPASPAPAEIIDLGPARQLLAARATMASIAAERARRELAAETGRFTLTAQANAALAQCLGEFLAAVEQSFPDLFSRLALSGEQAAAVRRWWRDHRVRAAAEAREAAAAEPEFIEDRETPTVDLLG